MSANTCCIIIDRAGALLISVLATCSRSGRRADAGFARHRQFDAKSAKVGLGSGTEFGSEQQNFIFGFWVRAPKSAVADLGIEMPMSDKPDIGGARRNDPLRDFFSSLLGCKMRLITP